MNALRLIKPFLKKHVKVETSLEAVKGRLEAFEVSHHNGIGCLIISNSKFNWILVKRWILISLTEVK